MILYAANSEKIKILVTAAIKQNGDLQVEGIDSGPLVKELKGDFDYEYFLTVKEADKHTLMTYLQKQQISVTTDDELLMWVKEQFGHDKSFSALMTFLNDAKIPFSTYFWE